MTIESQREAFRVSETCAKLGICASTFWNWKRDGLIKTVKIGRTTLIPRAEIDRILSTAA